MNSWDKSFDASYRFVRVKRQTGKEAEAFQNFQTGGTIDRNLDTAIKESGTVDIVGAPDFGADLVRVYLDATFSDGATQSEMLGTFLPVTTTRTTGGADAETATVDLYGRLKELDDVLPVQPFTVPKGTDLVAYAHMLIEEEGLEVIQNGTGYTSTVDLYYGIQHGKSEDSQDGSLLSIVNDLLSRSGFSAARTNPEGSVILTRSLPVIDRALTWTFTEGKNARFLCEFKEEHDTSHVANQVFAIFSENETVTIGTAQDDDENSPYSIQNVGRIISAKYEYQRKATEEQANAEAKRLLQNSRATLKKQTFSHIYCPVALGDAVQITYPSANIEGRYAVRTQRITLGAGCLVETEVRAYVR